MDHPLCLLQVIRDVTIILTACMCPQGTPRVSSVRRLIRRLSRQSNQTPQQSPALPSRRLSVLGKYPPFFLLRRIFAPSSLQEEILHLAICLSLFLSYVHASEY